ncbi:MAG TPA: DUF134 domain-containing protein [Clostridiaceae bacterium]|nr:DUF134 domain-containing protein [Clostridiaceae bacterium]
MARPMKWRRVCCLPETNSYGPLDATKLDSLDTIYMTVDEYEAIRLIDLEGFTQAECAKQMGVARTTVQGIYAKARHKMAVALVEPRILSIRGGEYRLCDGESDACHIDRGCRRGRGRGQGMGMGRGLGKGMGRGRGTERRGGQSTDRLSQSVDQSSETDL